MSLVLTAQRTSILSANGHAVTKDLRMYRSSSKKSQRSPSTNFSCSCMRQLLVRAKWPKIEVRCNRWRVCATLVSYYTFKATFTVNMSHLRHHFSISKPFMEAHSLLFHSPLPRIQKIKSAFCSLLIVLVHEITATHLKTLRFAQNCRLTLV